VHIQALGSSQGLMAPWLGLKMLFGETSFGKTSFGETLLGETPFGEMPFLGFRGNVIWGNVVWGNVDRGNCRSTFAYVRYIVTAIEAVLMRVFYQQ
jgi:hypothetical protein